MDDAGQEDLEKIAEGGVQFKNVMENAAVLYAT